MTVQYSASAMTALYSSAVSISGGLRAKEAGRTHLATENDASMLLIVDTPLRARLQTYKHIGFLQ